MDMNQYLDMFIEESKEHLQAINEQLLLLEKNPTDVSIVNEIFRSAHTLKGMSATMGYEDLAQLTHQMENVLDSIRNNKLAVTTEILDVVFQSIDDLEAMVTSIAEGGDGKRDVSEVVSKLESIENGTFGIEEVAATVMEADSEEKVVQTYDGYEYAVLQQSKEQGFEPYEITVTLREDCLLRGVRVFMVFEALEQLGEVIRTTPSVELLEEEKFDFEFSITFVSNVAMEEIQNRILKVSEVDHVHIEAINVDEPPREQEETKPVQQEQVTQPVVQEVAEVTPVKDVKQETNTKNKANQAANKTIRVNIERLDILMNLFEELVIDRGRLEQISKELNDVELQETVERMARISGDLQSIILNMRMVPVETVFNRFPRMVRQLARDLGKQVDLEIIGADTELDRTVIDEIGDPLVHLIRNALDHGLEMPDVRKEKGKSEIGTIKLKAYHSGNHVFIEIQDDGAGINRDKVLQKAISRGVVTEQQAVTMTDRQVFELILSSGFSTADKLSDISGRGVGLDVVKNTIESLGGSLTIDSVEGAGSTFAIQLPLTLSIISALLVEIKKEKYAIPLSSIIETAIVHQSDILSAHGQKVIDFRGNVVPLIFLKDIFEVPEDGVKEEYHSVVLVRKGDKTAGLVVNSFIGQQEIVLKSLGSYLDSVFAISGATILGDGQVALIIDCNALIK
ncbi:chemotaxis protein CheA [Priestia taiwanensis]|uniref:Chemotaxis protein CheA n=1 Tax=Priestia taiwanensis TaxID=1347902 RepID=A0A917APT7_9BACI|nr:chemotaxis protein CheA [Priestia taiwanensis]MBM7362821.1 two-component system chemotaxis sensor kinase CheA [Priestia taiwanensis]GGE65377.1 chemotaxis protein CheA [Priestia taiwanensis]